MPLPKAIRWPGLLALAAPVFPFAGQDIASTFLPIYVIQTTRMSVGALSAVSGLSRIADRAAIRENSYNCSENGIKTYFYRIDDPYICHKTATPRP